MTADPRDSSPVVLVRTRHRIYALSLENVVEIMRPLPTAAVPGMPAFLCGLALIRGEPVPVVDLGAFFDEEPDGDKQQRFVLLKIDRRRAALAVEAVLGVFRLEQSLRQELPPLLQGANADIVTAVSVRDRQILLVLQATQLVPDAVWRELEAKEKAS